MISFMALGICVDHHFSGASWNGTFWYFSIFILCHCLFCRLPCTTLGLPMATTLSRTRAGGKSKRSRRWENSNFLHLILFVRTCRMRRWGRPGWTSCSSASSPASSSSSTWSTGSAFSGSTHHKRWQWMIRTELDWDPTQSFWSVDLASYSTHFFFSFYKRSWFKSWMKTLPYDDNHLESKHWQ